MKFQFYPGRRKSFVYSINQKNFKNEKVWFMIQQWSEKLNNIESKLDKLQINMDEIQYLLSEMKSNLPKSYEMLYPKKHTIKKKKVIIDNRTKWRREVYRQIRILISKDCPYKKGQKYCITFIII